MTLNCTLPHQVFAFHVSPHTQGKVQVKTGGYLFKKYKDTVLMWISDEARAQEALAREEAKNQLLADHEPSDSQDEVTINTSSPP